MNRDKELIEAYWKWKEFKKPDFVFSDNLIAAFLAFLASDEYKAVQPAQPDVEAIVQAVVDAMQIELLKHLFPVRHQNDYPILAVPQAIILDMKPLVRESLRTAVALVVGVNTNNTKTE
jgi:hypothetical protein